MTRSLKRPPKAMTFRRRASVEDALAAAGLLLGIFSFVFSQPVFAIGAWPDVEAPIIAMHGGAALCAIAVAMAASNADLDPAICQPAALVALALALWSAALAPFMAFPWLSILGAPENAQGALQFAELALFMIVTARLSRRRAWRPWIAAAVIVAAWAATALQIFPRTRPEVFSEYLAYFGLAAAVAAYTLSPRIVLALPFSSLQLRISRPVIATLAAAPVLLASANRTAIAILGVTGLLVLVAAWCRLLAPGARLRHVRRLTAAFAFVLPIIVLVIVYIVGLDVPVASIRARTLLLQVMFSQLADEPRIWLIGDGWGQTSSIFATHLSAASVALWQDTWDAARRDIFHSHNEALEALLAAGLPGAVAALALCAMPIISAPRRLLPIAILFGIGMAGLAALWFQLPFTVAPVAVAYGTLSSRTRRTWSIGPSRAIAVLAGAAALVFATSAACLLHFGVAVNAAVGPDGLPRQTGDRCARFPNEDWRANLELATLFARGYQAVRADVAAGATVDAERYGHLAAFFCEADRRAADGRSAYLMLVTLVFRGELAFAADLEGARAQLSGIPVSWRNRLLAFLNRAPARSDVAATYLGYLLDQGNTSGVLRDSDTLLRRNPHDPVALWFSGVALIRTQSESTAGHQLAVARLRAALKNGIEKIMPVEPDLRNKILKDQPLVPGSTR